MKTEYKFFTAAEEAWEGMLRDCWSAKQSIDIEQYIFVCDSVGGRFCEVLAAKARAGVRVRLLCDAVGSYPFYNSNDAAFLSEAGVQVQFFNPISPWRIHNYSSWFFRDHRKLMIIDREIGHIGSLGVNERMANWRDTHVRFQGEIVSALEFIFSRMWEAAIKKKHPRFPKVATSAANFSIVSNSPRIGQRFIYSSLTEAFRSAKNYIYLTTPYFVPDLPFFRSLRLAAKRGVDVKLLLPGKSDLKFLDIAAKSYFGLAMKSGINIYLYRPDRILHAKSAVVDDAWATVGSCNFDNNSLKYNYEANVNSTEPKFVLELKKHFLADIMAADQIDRENWGRRSIVSKITEAITWPIHNFL